jgi:hypothetical protein
MKDAFIKFCNEKFPNDIINENIIAGECQVSIQTVNNWADKSNDSTPKLPDVKVLCELAKIDYNQFINLFIQNL